MGLAFQPRNRREYRERRNELMRVWKKNQGSRWSCEAPAARVERAGRSKRLALNTAAAALLGVAVGGDVVIVTDEGLATVAPHPGNGTPGFRVSKEGSASVTITCSSIPDDVLPHGKHELRMTRIGWAWGEDRQEQDDPIDDGFNAILELPPWKPPVDQSNWIEALDDGE